jgi:hydrogenase maturation protein HypF
VGARLIHVVGVVQGVGYRPFVVRLAHELDLDGWVRNDSGTVEIHAEGGDRALSAFVTALRGEWPPIARVDAVRVERATPSGARGFSPKPSHCGDGRLPVSPDVATCERCVKDLFDETSRRVGYPFTTCTACGPRYSIINSMPYDRERTGMSIFVPCAECLAEYHSIWDRRYHSETNACEACGPRIWLEDDGGGRIDGAAREVIEAAVELLGAGGILAILGIGGFHLAVDARNDRWVRRLREHKYRDAKPFALMVRTLEEAARIAHVSPAERALLESHAAPVVLLRPRSDADIAESVAPGLATTGIMLAYTPLHHLLLDAYGGPLVMTSGNASETPILTTNEEAATKLHGVADARLVHDRPIVARCDDSVVRMSAEGPIFLRRSRGYAPLPLSLPVATPRPLLAVGPHLKNTFTIAEGSTAYVSPHIGDLENLETLLHFRETLRHLEALYGTTPEIVVRDEHPGYLSTREAGRMGFERVIGVQHHHAHVAAVLAEHGRTERALGLAFDGVGYGGDRTIWGGELLVASLTDYERIGYLRPAPMPGGDLAARSPWRCLVGYGTLDEDLATALDPLLPEIPVREVDVARRQAMRGVNAPLASSMGRLFDAAACLIGVRSIASYEGQAPMELEALAADRRGVELPFPTTRGRDGCAVLDPVPLLRALLERRRSGEEPPELAASFHESVAATAARLAIGGCEREGLAVVVLSGGVFQNARLLGATASRLRRARIAVLVSRTLGPGDGAISYGQAAIAASRLAIEGGG